MLSVTAKTICMAVLRIQIRIRILLLLLSLYYLIQRIYCKIFLLFISKLFLIPSKFCTVVAKCRRITIVPSPTRKSAPCCPFLCENCVLCVKNFIFIYLYSTRLQRQKQPLLFFRACRLILCNYLIINLSVPCINICLVYVK